MGTRRTSSSCRLGRRGHALLSRRQAVAGHGLEGGGTVTAIAQSQRNPDRVSGQPAEDRTLERRSQADELNKAGPAALEESQTRCACPRPMSTRLWGTLALASTATLWPSPTAAQIGIMDLSRPPRQERSVEVRSTLPQWVAMPTDARIRPLAPDGRSHRERGARESGGARRRAALQVPPAAERRVQGTAVRVPRAGHRGRQARCRDAAVGGPHPPGRHVTLSTHRPGDLIRREEAPRRSVPTVSMARSRCRAAGLCGRTGSC